MLRRCCIVIHRASALRIDKLPYFNIADHLPMLNRNIVIKVAIIDLIAIGSICRSKYTIAMVAVNPRYRPILYMSPWNRLPVVWKVNSFFHTRGLNTHTSTKLDVET